MSNARTNQLEQKYTSEMQRLRKQYHALKNKSDRDFLDKQLSKMLRDYIAYIKTVLKKESPKELEDLDKKLKGITAVPFNDISKEIKQPNANTSRLFAFSISNAYKERPTFTLAENIASITRNLKTNMTRAQSNVFLKLQHETLKECRRFYNGKSRLERTLEKLNPFLGSTKHTQNIQNNPIKIPDLDRKQIKKLLQYAHETERSLSYFFSEIGNNLPFTPLKSPYKKYKPSIQLCHDVVASFLKNGKEKPFSTYLNDYLIKNKKIKTTLDDELKNIITSIIKNQTSDSESRLTDSEEKYKIRNNDQNTLLMDEDESDEETSQDGMTTTQPQTSPKTTTQSKPLLDSNSLINQIGDYQLKPHDVINAPINRTALIDTPDKKSVLFARIAEYKKNYSDEIENFLYNLAQSNVKKFDYQDLLTHKKDQKFFRALFLRFLENHPLPQYNEKKYGNAREKEPDAHAIKMSDLFSNIGATLYQLALKEETHDPRFIEAVWHHANEVHAQPSLPKRIISFLSGASGSGKSHAAKALIAKMPQILNRPTTNNKSPHLDSATKADNQFVFIDGGRIREASQIRKLAIAVANKQGFPGIQDIHIQSKCLESVKSRLYHYAIGTKHHLIIPETFSDFPTPKSFGRIMFNKACQLKKEGEAEIIFTRVIGNNQETFQKVVAHAGALRAWKTNFKGEVSIDDLNAKSEFESKKYQGKGFRFGHAFSEFVQNFFKTIFKDPITLLITNDLSLKVETKPDQWVDASTGNGKVLMVSQRVFNAWNESNKKRTLEQYNKEEMKNHPPLIETEEEREKRITSGKGREYCQEIFNYAIALQIKKQGWKAQAFSNLLLKLLENPIEKFADLVAVWKNEPADENFDYTNWEMLALEKSPFTNISQAPPSDETDESEDVSDDVEEDCSTVNSKPNSPLANNTIFHNKSDQNEFFPRDFINKLLEKFNGEFKFNKKI